MSVSRISISAASGSRPRENRIVRDIGKSPGGKMQEISIINASKIVPDSDFPPMLAALQKHIDRDFLPNWPTIKPARLAFYPWERFDAVPADAWPIFVNRHSIDPGALAWHTQEGLRI